MGYMPWGDEVLHGMTGAPAGFPWEVQVCLHPLVIMRASPARPPNRRTRSEPRGPPHGHPAAQVLLDGQVVLEQVADLDLQQVVALLRAVRRERVEGAPLVQVDQAEP